MTIPPTGYWIFMCNPARWAIDRFLETNQAEDTYQVTEARKHQFVPGQLGVVRVGIDTRTREKLYGRRKLKAGIYGIVEVLTTAYPRPSDYDDEYWYNPDENNNQRSIVDIRYRANLLSSPILLEDLSIVDGIDKNLIEGRQESSFPLQQDTFERIIKLSDTHFGLENIKPVIVKNVAKVLELEQLYKNARPIVREHLSKRIERGPLGAQIKQLTNYECMICNALGERTHTFKTKHGDQYVEAHHVIPVATENIGVLHSANILTVCANHHRQLHYGNVKVLGISENEFTFSIDGQTVKIPKFASENFNY